METRIQATYPHGHAGIHTCTHTLTHANCKQETGVRKRLCPWMLLHTRPCLSPSPRCHPAAAPSTHYLVSCDSISESVGPEERKKNRRKKKRASQLLLNSDDKTKSLSLHGLHQKFQRCQSGTNKLRPPETTPLMKTSCSA